MTEHMRERRRRLLAGAKKIVVKVGSGVLTGESYTDISEPMVAEISRQVAGLVRGGRKVAIVSSGSVAIGSRILEVARHGLSIPMQQAAAALGQGTLIRLWTKRMEAEGLRVGQILLTHDDLSNRRRFLNSRNTIYTLFDYNAVPVINENDTVAVHEIKFGDNDTLSARVTNLMEADLLVILSDVDGLYSGDPRLDDTASRIDFVEEVDESILSMAKDSSTRTGLGGMASKVRAAAEAARFGIPTLILPGARKGCLAEALDGQSDTLGTFFFPHEDRLSSKKHWIEFTLRPSGTITVDGGAKKAVIDGGKSLLASGITAVEGVFESGEAVMIGCAGEEPFAKGLASYHSHEIEKIKGARSGEIEKILGYKIYDEVIHRDDMVFFKRG